MPNLHSDDDETNMPGNDTFDKDQYEALCKQEQEYMAQDYMYRLPLIGMDCREKMIAWFYQVVEHCKFEREVVEITVNYLDRFLSNEDMIHPDTTRDDFQLIAMTCLYVAVKIQEPVAMEPATVSCLSGGVVTKEDIEACERQLLRGLGWRMNPPTTVSFVRMALSSRDLSPSEEQEVLKLCNMQLEATLVADYYSFLSVPPSTLAAAALSNSLRALGYDDELSSVQVGVAHRLARTLPRDQPLVVSHETRAAAAATKRKTFVTRHESSGEVSPKCVSVHPR